MPAVLSNTFHLTTRDKRELVFTEQSSGLICGLLADETGAPIQAHQLSALRLWLYLKDTPDLPIGGINGVSDTDILNDGLRGSIGSGKAIVGATVQTVHDDYFGRVRLTIIAHGYSAGTFIAVRGVRGIKGANGEWFVEVIDQDTVELIGSTGVGTYLSGGIATKGLHLQLQPGDNAIVQSPAPAVGAVEWHEAYVRATFNGKEDKFLIRFQVKNLGKVS